MTSHIGGRLSSTTWGPGGRPGRAWPGLLDGTLLLCIWMALWSVFVLGVVEPAARFRSAARVAEQSEGSCT